MGYTRCEYCERVQMAGRCDACSEARAEGYEAGSKEAEDRILKWLKNPSGHDDWLMANFVDDGAVMIGIIAGAIERGIHLKECGGMHEPDASTWHEDHTTTAGEEG